MLNEKNWPEVVGIGSTVYDTLMVTDGFPAEDTKMMGVATKVQGGGPCATALVAAQKLGVSTAYMGTIGDDPFGTFMMDDFKKWGVDTRYIRVVPGGISFHAVVVLNQQTSSRTCVWSKGTVEAPKESDVNLEALSHAGADLGGEPVKKKGDGITKLDLYTAGLSGRPDSQKKREAFLSRLRFPAHMSANALLDALNLLYTREEFLSLFEETT